MNNGQKNQLKKMSPERLREILAETKAGLANAKPEDLAEANELIQFIETILAAAPAVEEGKEPAEESELEKLRRENAELRAAKETAAADEGVIREKIGAGLSREQAVASIQNQKHFDERAKIVAESKAKAAAKKEAAKK